MPHSPADLSYLDLTEDDLLLVIGDRLLAGSLGSKEASDTEKRQAAARWLDGYLAGMRQRICGNETLRRQCGKPVGDRNDLFALLFDIVFTHTLGVPAGALTSLILKVGLPKICPDWK